MYQPVIFRSYLTEVKLVNPPTNGDKVPFLDIPQIRNVRTIGIECFQRADLSVTPNSNVTVNLLTGMIVTFSVQSTEEIYQFPCNDLRPANNAGLIRLFKEKVINFPKSYITIMDNTGLSQNEAVLFNIIYQLPAAR